MEISKLKTLLAPSVNDVLPILDINGGVSGKPILRKATLSSLLALVGSSGDPISQEVIDAINAQLTTLNTEYSNLNTSVQNNTTSLSALIAANFGNRISQLNSTLATLNTAYTAYVAANNVVVNNTSNALSTLTTTVNNNITSDDTRLDAVEFSQSGLQSNYNSLTNTVITLSQTVTGQGQIVDYINNENATQRVQISDLQSQVAALELLLPSTIGRNIYFSNANDSR
jgi:uncharacterized coiled-coil protein SlyX